MLRSIVLLFLLARLCSEVHTSNATEGSGDQTNVDFIVNSTCGQNVEIQPAPSTGFQHTRKLFVEFENMTVTDTNCSWIIHPLSNASSNFFFIDNVFRKAICNVGGLSLYDVNPSSGNLSVISDGCSNLSDPRAVVGRIGYPTLIRFTTQNVTVNRRTALATYGSKEWTNEGCMRNAQITASYEEQIIHVPALRGLRVPNGLTCGWVLSVPEKGALTIELFSSISTDAGNPPETCESDDKFLVLDTGHALMKEPAFVKLCEEGTRFEHTSYSGTVVLAFVSGDRGGAPNFLISYEAEGIDFLCPLKYHTTLRPTAGRTEVLKAVNHLNGTLGQRDCWWDIRAPDDTKVVKLERIYNVDYLADCRKEDWLRIGENRVLGMCENNAFPLWSNGSQLQIQFHTSANTPPREFLIYYTTVERGNCQGHPSSLLATKQPMTVVEYALPRNGTSDGTDCRWLITAEKSGSAIEIRIPLTVSAKSTYACYSRRVSLYGGTQASLGSLLSPRSCLNDTTLIYIIQPADSVLVVFNRDPDNILGHSVEDFEMSYVAIEKYGGDTNSADASVSVSRCVKVVVFCLCCAFLDALAW